MIFEAIAELIADRNDIDVSEITPDSRFEDLGIDSLDTVEMLMDLEDRIGFYDIPRIIGTVMDGTPFTAAPALDEIFAINDEARARAESMIG